jgi:signal peptidase I
MKEDGEIEEGLPSGEEEAEQEPQPLYDPLTEPWNDPASTSVVEHRLSEGRGEFATRPGAAPRYWERPFPDVEELSELRRRLREETVVVPKRERGWPEAIIILTGLVLLASSALAAIGVYPIARQNDVVYVINAIIGGVLLFFGAARLVSSSPASRIDWEAPQQEAVAVPKPRRIWAVTLRELTETLLLAVLIFLAVHVSMQNFKVEGASMEPSLDNGEYLIVNRLAYAEIDLSIFDWVPFFDAGDNPVHHLWSSPARGDVIVFRSPTSPGFERDFIKRIIGVPGDVVEIDRETGVVRVNEQAINEPYIRGKTNCSSSCGPWVVPERSYLVMGDNRNNSSDSRQGWFVPEENIIGKALITYWYDGSPELDLAPNHEVSFISEAAAEE